MKPYPLVLLNHFTVPCTSPSLLTGTSRFRSAAPANNPNAVKDTNRAECIRIEVPVNRPFFFIAKINLYLSGHKTVLMDSAGITASPGRETGNSRESRRWTWHRVTSRRASSSRVLCVYRHGKLFSHPLRVPPRLRSGLPQAAKTSVLPGSPVSEKRPGKLAGALRDSPFPRSARAPRLLSAFRRGPSARRLTPTNSAE